MVDSNAINDETPVDFEHHPPRKRRRVECHKSYIRKQTVERGEERQAKTKIIPAKKFNGQSNCNCSKGKKPKPSCANRIGVERQKQIYDAFYHDMLWMQKTLFLRGSVERIPVTSKKSSSFPLIALKNREYNHIYSLTDENGVKQIVCRDFFFEVPSSDIEPYIQRIEFNC